jgi:hypothetical protein
MLEFYERHLVFKATSEEPNGHAEDGTSKVMVSESGEGTEEKGDD